MLARTAISKRMLWKCPFHNQQLFQPSELPEQGSNLVCLHHPMRHDETINLQLPTFVLFLLVTLLFMDCHFVHINILLITTCKTKGKVNSLPTCCFHTAKFFHKGRCKKCLCWAHLERTLWLRQCAGKKSQAIIKSRKIKCFMVRKFRKLKFLLKH